MHVSTTLSHRWWSTISNLSPYMKKNLAKSVLITGYVKAVVKVKRYI